MCVCCLSWEIQARLRQIRSRSSMLKPMSPADVAIFTLNQNLSQRVLKSGEKHFNLLEGIITKQK